jgi:hypothetical protein
MDFVYNCLLSFHLAGVENNTSVAAVVYAQAHLFEFI